MDKKLQEIQSQLASTLLSNIDDDLLKEHQHQSQQHQPQSAPPSSSSQQHHTQALNQEAFSVSGPVSPNTLLSNSSSSSSTSSSSCSPKMLIQSSGLLNGHNHHHHQHHQHHHHHPMTIKVQKDDLFSSPQSSSPSSPAPTRTRSSTSSTSSTFSTGSNASSNGSVSVSATNYYKAPTEMTSFDANNSASLLRIRSSPQKTQPAASCFVPTLFQNRNFSNASYLANYEACVGKESNDAASLAPIGRPSQLLLIASSSSSSTSPDSSAGTNSDASASASPESFSAQINVASKVENLFYGESSVGGTVATHQLIW